MKTSWHSLKIVPTESLEPLCLECENSIRQAVDYLKRDGHQKSPLAITGTDNGKSVILDGISRWAAFRKLGVKDILVQVVPQKDSNLILSSWRHIVNHLTSKELGQIAAKLKLDMSPINPEELNIGTLSHNDRVIALTGDNSAYQINIDRSDIVDFTQKLRSLVQAYSSNSQVIKIASEPGSNAHLYYGRGAAFMILPTYRKSEVDNLYQAGEKLPANLLCFSFPRRFLGIKISLSILSEDVSAEEKNGFLDELLKMRMSYSRATYYPQSVYLMND